MAKKQHIKLWLTSGTAKLIQYYVLQVIDDTTKTLGYISINGNMFLALARMPGAKYSLRRTYRGCAHVDPDKEYMDTAYYLDECLASILLYHQSKHRSGIPLDQLTYTIRE